MTTRTSRPAYFFIFLCAGLAFGIIGPSLPLLADRSAVTVGEIGTVLVFYGLGYLVGTRLFVRGYDKGWGNKLAASAIGCSAFCFALVPLGSNVVLISAAFFCFGAALSTSDVGCNTMIVWELREKSGASLAFMHTMFGVGAIVSPFIVRASDSFNGSAHFAYWFGSAMLLSSGLFVLTRTSPPDPHVEIRAQQGDLSRSQIGYIVLYFFGYVAVEVAFATWIYTYATRIGMPKIEAALVNSLFWVGFMLGRLATVWLARLPNSLRFVRIAVLVNLTVCAVLLVGLDSTLIVLAPIYGLATAPQFPLMLAYIGTRIPLSGKMTSRVVGTAGLSSTVMPWLTGQVLENVGLWTFPITLAAAAFAVLVATGLIVARLPKALIATT